MRNWRFQTYRKDWVALQFVHKFKQKLIVFQNNNPCKEVRSFTFLFTIHATFSKAHRKIQAKQLFLAFLIPYRKIQSTQ